MVGAPGGADLRVEQGLSFCHPHSLLGEWEGPGSQITWGVILFRLTVSGSDQGRCLQGGERRESPGAEAVEEGCGCYSDPVL